MASEEEVYSEIKPSTEVEQDKAEVVEESLVKETKPSEPQPEATDEVSPPPAEKEEEKPLPSTTKPEVTDTVTPPAEKEEDKSSQSESSDTKVTPQSIKVKSPTPEKEPSPIALEDDNKTSEKMSVRASSYIEVRDEEALAPPAKSSGVSESNHLSSSSSSSRNKSSSSRSYHSSHRAYSQSRDYSVPRDYGIADFRARSPNVAENILHHPLLLSPMFEPLRNPRLSARSKKALRDTSELSVIAPGLRGMLEVCWSMFIVFSDS